MIEIEFAEHALCLAGASHGDYRHRRAESLVTLEAQVEPEPRALRYRARRIEISKDLRLGWIGILRSNTIEDLEGGPVGRWYALYTCGERPRDAEVPPRAGRARRHAEVDDDLPRRLQRSGYEGQENSRPSVDDVLGVAAPSIEGRVSISFADAAIGSYRSSTTASPRAGERATRYLSRMER